MPKVRIASVVGSYLTLFGALLALFVDWDPQRGSAALTAGTAVVCALPLLVCGLVLGLHRGDPQQFLAKLVACAGMPPILLLFWAGEAAAGERTLWPAMTAFALGHALCFVLFILWAAPVTTRVAARRGVAPVTPEQLCARLCALPASGLPCSVTRGPEPQRWFVDYAFAPAEKRSLRFTLDLDVPRRTVHVRERESSSGAAPRNAAEADMRPLGTVGIDPSRPKAKAVHGTAQQATFLDPDKLAAVPLELQGDRAHLPESFARAADGTQLAYVLGALVTRSGWTWAPILFEFQKQDQE